MLETFLFCFLVDGGDGGGGWGGGLEIGDWVEPS